MIKHMLVRGFIPICMFSLLAGGACYGSTVITAPNPSIAGVYLADITNTSDSDADSFYETYDFNIRINADISSGSTTVAARVICTNTGQVWNTDAWTIVGTEIDWCVVPFSESSFYGKLTAPVNLDFTVELWNSTFSRKYATTTTVIDEPFPAEPAPVIRTSMISAVRNTTDTDGDGYFEFFDFDIQIEADTMPDSSAVVAAKIVCPTTGQSWTAGPWTINGTSDDPFTITLDQSVFGGRLTAPANLDFTVELWNGDYSARYDTDTSVDNEPLRADPLPLISDVRLTDLSNTVDSDDDGFFESFRFKIMTDADMPDGSSQVAARIICITTGQSWDTDPWIITGWAIDYNVMALDHTSFRGHLSGPSELDFTVELWDASFTYRYAVRSAITGEPIKVEPVYVSMTIPDAKKTPDGSEVQVTGIITAIFNDSIYIQDTSRFSGIRVEMPSDNRTIGEVVSVSGTVNGSQAERYLAVNSVQVQGNQTPARPVGMLTRNCGGSHYFYNRQAASGQSGVVNGQGPNNIGLFTLVSGRVTYAESGLFYLDDGCSLDDGMGHKGLRVYNLTNTQINTNQYLQVTGVISCFSGADAGLHPAVLAAEIRIL